MTAGPPANDLAFGGRINGRNTGGGNLEFGHTGAVWFVVAFDVTNVGFAIGCEVWMTGDRINRGEFRVRLLKIDNQIRLSHIGAIFERQNFPGLLGNKQSFGSR